MSCSFGKEPLRLWCRCDGTDSVGRDLTRKQKQLFSQLVESCAFNERVSAHNSLALLYCCVAVVISLCVTISGSLRSRLQYVEETGAPLYIPRSSPSSGPAQKKPTLVNNLGDLRVTVRNIPPSQSP